MKSSNLLINVLALTTLWISTVSNPDGFLSINCGASQSDTVKGLDWVSDSSFIKSRNVSTLPPFQVSQETKLQYKSLAYFANVRASKYCYVLPVRPGINYLVRATFSYGGFQVPNLASVFDLLIQGILWTKVDMRNLDPKSFRFHEMILSAKSENLSLCLARNSETQDGDCVFISTIELRELQSRMYNSTVFNNKALNLISRRNYGVSGAEGLRYPEDPFDRIWNSYTIPSMTVQSTQTSLSQPSGSFWNQPPSKVLQTSVTEGLIANMNILRSLQSDQAFSPGSYYLALYFCNLNLSSFSSGATFKVYINNMQETEWLHFNYLQCWAIYRNSELGINSNLSVTLSPAQGTNVPPFINAAEVYKILDIQNTTHPGDVLAIRKIAAETTNAPDDWTGGDVCLPVEHPLTGIICNEESPRRVIIVNLTNMGLSGNIPQSIANLTALTQILLGNNSLSGFIPDLSSLQNLTTLQMQDNQLTGNIPPSLEKLPMLEQLILQNNFLDPTVPSALNKSGLDLRVLPQNNFSSVVPQNKFYSKNQKKKSWIIGLSIGCMALVTFLAFLIWRHKCTSQAGSTNSHTHLPQQSSADEDQNGHHRLARESKKQEIKPFLVVEEQNEYYRQPREFSEQDIEEATNKYATEIGHGAFGIVYRGKLSGREVAVKILSKHSKQGENEFRNEVTFLSRIYHKSLVNLVGYCKQSVVALVYEYMDNGALKDHLYGSRKLENPLNWRTRLNIALQAAEGLQYLHEGCSPPIVHRDIKCNNILLDSRMSARIADFGLSKLLDNSHGQIFTRTKGTPGYVDPEYHRTSKLTEKSDVYSFGVVLLEIISGIPPSEGIVDRARELLSSGRVEDLMDSSLPKPYNLASARIVGELAKTCVEPQAIKRPNMSGVVKQLEKAMALEFGIEDITSTSESKTDLT